MTYNQAERGLQSISSTITISDGQEGESFNTLSKLLITPTGLKPANWEEEWSTTSLRGSSNQHWVTMCLKQRWVGKGSGHHKNGCILRQLCCCRSEFPQTMKLTLDWVVSQGTWKIMTVNIGATNPIFSLHVLETEYWAAGAGKSIVYLSMCAAINCTRTKVPDRCRPWKTVTGMSQRLWKAKTVSVFPEQPSMMVHRVQLLCKATVEDWKSQKEAIQQRHRLKE